MTFVRHLFIRSGLISAAVVAGWLILGSFYWSQDLLIMQMRGIEAPMTEIGSVAGITTVLWMLLTPLILYVTQFVRLERATLGRSLMVAIALIVGFAIVRIAMGLAVIPVMEDRLPTSADVSRGLAVRFHANVTLAGIVVGSRLIWDFAKAIREKDRRELVLRSELARAQLEQLKGQLHPHFLFNALNGIATLVHTDARRADSMLMELSALLRATLDLGDEDLIPLGEELALLDRYLNLQQMRFAERLEVERTIHPETLSWLVPPFIMQPLVENSLRHVVEKRPAGGLIRIESVIDGDSLRLSVVDDGTGFDPAEVDFGVGIANVRGRLAQLYGDEASLDHRKDESGFRAVLSIPGDIG